MAEKSIVVVYHSGYGHTAKQAHAVALGAKVGEINVTLMSVDELTDADKTSGVVALNWDILNSADAIVFGAPVYMGSLSAKFKKFMEDSSKLWMTQSWKDKLAAGFVNSGSLNGDKQNGIIQLISFAAQHSMLWVTLGLMPANNSKSQRNDLNRMGAFLGAFAQSDVDLGADVAPPEGDLNTAKYLGQRVAELVHKLR